MRQPKDQQHAEDTPNDAQKSAGNTDPDRMMRVFSIELVENMIDVRIDRAHAAAQPRRDLLPGQPFGQQRIDLALTLRQRRRIMDGCGKLHRLLQGNRRLCRRVN